MKRTHPAVRLLLAWLLATTTLVGAGSLVSAPAQAATRSYTVIANVAKVRATKSVKATAVGVLTKGKRILATGSVRNGWLPVRWDSRTAWVRASATKRDTRQAVTTVTGPAGRKTVIKDAVFRLGASASATAAAVRPKGSVVKVTGETRGAYTKILVGVSGRWVLTSHLSSTTDTTPDPVAYYTTTESLAFRLTASIDATSQLTIPSGQTVGGQGSHSGSYSKVSYQGKLGWVITGYLAAVSGTPDDLVLPIATKTLYVLPTSGSVVRGTASASGTKLASVSWCTRLRSTGVTDDGFISVIWDGGIAWIDSSTVTTNKALATDLGSTSLNKLEPNGRLAVVAIRKNFPTITTIYGWRASSAYSSDHPNGRAVDAMIRSYKTNTALGDAVATYFITNADSFHVTYVIWRQRIYTISSGKWKAMADRGSITANHYNHVHISFKPS